MKAVDRQHYYAIEKLRKQIEKDKSGTGIKKVYFVELVERHEIKTEDIDGLGTYYDAYGVWFAGSIGAAVMKRCGYLHAFISAKPEKCEEGVFDITAYNIPCKLYFWNAQGYNRGMVVATNDILEQHQAAADLLAEKPWSFQPIFRTISRDVEITLAPRITPSPVVVDTGKYAGKTLEELFEKDVNIIIWLSENSKNPKIKEGAKRLLEAKTATV